MERKYKVTWRKMRNYNSFDLCLLVTDSCDEEIDLDSVKDLFAFLFKIIQKKWEKKKKKLKTIWSSYDFLFFLFVRIFGKHLEINLFFEWNSFSFYQEWSNGISLGADFKASLHFENQIWLLTEEMWANLPDFGWVLNRNQRILLKINNKVKF